MKLKFSQFVFAPDIIPTIVFFLVLICLLSLGNWQLNRAEEKQRLVDSKSIRQAAAPLNLNINNMDEELDRFRPATVKGKYVGKQQWLLDNRLFRGQPGYHVFSLLELSNNKRLLVNRGWVSVGTSREILPNISISKKNVVLKGHLDKPESVGLVMGEQRLESFEEKVVLQSLEIKRIERARSLNLLPLSLVLDKDQSGSLQYDWSPVETISPEKHVGYAVQWFALAFALVIIYFGVNTRRLNNKNNG
tara:strand:- start:21925 stop:22668 length:744 start_codon:yes stop_codon:yes gene_type:complete